MLFTIRHEFRQCKFAKMLERRATSYGEDDCFHVCLLRQDCVVSLPKPEHDRFHVASAQRNPAIPRFALLIPSTSSPCLYANEGR